MMNQSPTEVEKARGLHRFAVLTAGATFCLIFVGGLVTSTGSALAVPDWPLAFGKLIPAWQGGIRFEFGHRLAAGTVVVLTLVLMAWAWRAEPRQWVRQLVMLAFGLIIVQAVLGGITVLFELPLAIAVTHAATAQALFCLMVSIAIFTNPRWDTTPHVDDPPSRIPLTTLAVATTAIIYMQILVGALMRHMSAGLVIPDFPLSFGYVVPPYWNEFIAVNFAHRCGAVVVTAMVLWTVARVLRTHREVVALRRPALGLFLLLVVQICLGAITIWSGRSVIPTTSHVAVGAAVLATSLTLTLRAYRILGVPNRAHAIESRASFARSRTAGDRVNAKVAIAESALTLPRGRVSDYFELTKPRVVLMVLVTTLAGFYLGGRAGFDITLALNLLAGTALAAGGTLALNQYVERDTDAMMDRTRNRPLPDLRMRPAEALTFGVIATAGGLVYLTARDEPALRRGDCRNHDRLPRRVHSAEALHLDVQYRRRDSRRAPSRRRMGRGARRSQLGADHTVRDHVPVAVAAYDGGRAALSHRLRARRHPSASARQCARRKCFESNRHRGKPRTHRGGHHPDHAWLRGNPVHGNRVGAGRLDAGVWSGDGACARQFESGAPVAARVISIFANRVVSTRAGSRVSNRNDYAWLRAKSAKRKSGGR